MTYNLFTLKPFTLRRNERLHFVAIEWTAHITCQQRDHSGSCGLGIRISGCSFSKFIKTGEVS